MGKARRKLAVKSRKKPRNKKYANAKGQRSERIIIRDDMDCEVCGEKARSHNFGGISCNPCRTFFHHFILNNLKHNLSTSHLKKDCKFKGKCKIDQVTRKKCKTCRFFKCVKIGMSPEWVIAEYKKKNKSIESPKLKLSDEETEKIASISNFFETACELIPYTFLSREENEVVSPTKLNLIIIGALSTGIRRFACFARMIPEFKKLSLHDQTNLLKRSVVEMLVIRDIITYDTDKGVFYAPGFPEKFPIVTEEEWTVLMKTYDDGLTDRYVHLYKRVHSIAPDEESMMLLIPLALFSDCGGNDSCTDFDDRPAINAAQELYTGLLEKYLKTTLGEEKGKLVFPRLLSQMVGVTQIAQLHQGLSLNMTEDQVNKMHQHLHYLQKKTGTSQPLNNDYFKDNLIPPEQLANKQRECCKKHVTPPKSLTASNRSSSKETSFNGYPSSSPSLIHAFVNITSEWRVQQNFFEKGVHVGIEKAFMRRMPELVQNPWDSLVNDVSKLSISNS